MIQMIYRSVVQLSQHCHATFYPMSRISAFFNGKLNTQNIVCGMTSC